MDSNRASSSTDHSAERSVFIHSARRQSARACAAHQKRLTSALEKAVAEGRAIFAAAACAVGSSRLSRPAPLGCVVAQRAPDPPSKPCIGDEQRERDETERLPEQRACPGEPERPDEAVQVKRARRQRLLRWERHREYWALLLLCVRCRISSLWLSRLLGTLAPVRLCLLRTQVLALAHCHERSAAAATQRRALLTVLNRHVLAADRVVYDPTLISLAAPRGLRLLLVDFAASSAGPAAQRAKQAALARRARLLALGMLCRRALLSLRVLLVVCILIVALDPAGQRL